jgi:hypothetical protein
MGAGSRGRIEYGRDESEMMSPALAQALFNMALLPLLRGTGDEHETQDPVRALAAYTRASRD